MFRSDDRKAGGEREWGDIGVYSSKAQWVGVAVDVLSRSLLCRVKNLCSGGESTTNSRNASRNFLCPRSLESTLSPQTQPDVCSIASLFVSIFSTFSGTSILGSTKALQSGPGVPSAAVSKVGLCFVSQRSSPKSPAFDEDCSRRDLRPGRCRHKVQGRREHVPGTERNGGRQP